MPAVVVQLRKWCQGAQAATVQFAGTLRDVWHTPEKGEEATDHVLALLSQSCFSTGDSALGLVSTGKLWDADILVRTVAEGTAKFAFICHADIAERVARVEEFSITLPDVASLRDSERVRALIDIIPEPAAPEWLPLHALLLAPDVVAALRQKYSRPYRAQLEQRWSFTEIVKSLAGSGEGGEAMVALLHGYGMSSHIAHADWIGAGILWERQQRTPAEIEAVELAHGARIITDVVITSFVRAVLGRRYKDLDTGPLLALKAEIEPLFDELRRANESFTAMEYGPR